MKTEAIDRTLVFGSRRIPYRLYWSDRKTLRIVVLPNLDVEAHAPANVKERDVLEALQKKAPWIARRLDRILEFHPLPTPLNYVSGETIVYLGRQYRLKVHAGAGVSAKLQGQFLCVTVPEKTDVDRVKSALDAWYQARALDVFTRYAESCHRVASRHGVPKANVQIRNMRTRWGSCSSKGRVVLNINLVQAPVQCVEYVVMRRALPSATP